MLSQKCLMPSTPAVEISSRLLAVSMRSWLFSRIARIGEAIVVRPPQPTRLALSATGVPGVEAPSPPARIVDTSVYPAAPVTEVACRSSMLDLQLGRLQQVGHGL